MASPLFSVQFLRYLAVGGSAACLQFVMVWAGLNLLGLAYPMAVSLGYGASVLFHFTANRMFTFGAHGGAWLRQGLRYLGLVAINYVITLAVVSLVVEFLGLSVYLGVAAGIGATVVSGFFIAKYWVFTQGVH